MDRQAPAGYFRSVGVIVRRISLPSRFTTISTGSSGLRARRMTAGVVSGESGAAGLGALFELLDRQDAHTVRARLGIDNNSRVLIISTEGATDPASYEQIVGRPPAAVRYTPG